MIKVAWKGLAARPVRTALTTLAIVIGVAFVSAAYTLTDTMRGAADKLSAAAYDGTDAVVTARTTFRASQMSDVQAQAPTLPASTLERVRAVAGVDVAAGDITDTAEVIGRNGKPAGSGPYFGIGFDARTPGAERLTPFRLRAGRWATGPGQVVIDQATASKQKYEIGDTVRVTTRGAAAQFKLAGVASFAGVKSLGTATVAIFDLGAAQRLFDKDGYDRILVGGHVVGRSLAGAIGPHAQIRSAAADDRFSFDGLKSFIKIIRTILLVFAGVAVVVGAFTIFNSLSITVAQRTREFGLLRMVGASRRQVRRGVLVEAFAVGGLASAAGIGVGVALAEGLNALFAAVGLDLPQVGLVLSGRTIAASLAVGMLATLAAAWLPARRATRIAPVAALRDGAADGGRVGRFARLVRGVASVVGRPAAWVGGSAGALARRNAMRNPGRTAATASALMIGVALVTAVTVVAKGLDSSSRGSLSDRVHATAVITGADGWSPIDPKAEQAAAAAPGVKAVASIRQDGALVFGRQESINGVDPDAIARLYGDGSLASARGDGAVVAERYAKKHSLAIGDRFTLTSIKGAELALVVRAIEPAPKLDVLGLGPITISGSTFERAFEQRRDKLTFVDGPVDSVRRALTGFPDAKVDTKRDFIDGQTAWIGQILAILWVLLALAVIVSLFGIVNTLVLSTFERMRELGTLRALGMHRRQVRRMVRHESVITALIGAVLGIASGLALAAGLVAWLGRYGFAFAVPAGILLAVAVIAGLAGMLAAALPARRAARVNVLNALAYE